MTREEEALATVVALLDEAGIPYMVTGSVAASYHGRPRATHDSDLVIDPTPEQLQSLVDGLLDADFCLPAERALDALRSRRPFNVIDTRYACKIDLIIRRERPFSQQEFGRRMIADLSLGRPVSIVTAADAILSKLEWARLAGVHWRLGTAVGRCRGRAGD